MIDNKDILQELRDLNSPLADMSRSMPYMVPGGYFERLAYDITHLIQPDPVLHAGKALPYELPKNYFTSFAASLGQKIEEADESSLLKTMTPYAAPANYFDNLPAQILSKARKSEQAAPVKAISLRVEIFRQVRWAAAAILVLGIGLGSMKMFVRSESVRPELGLSKISSTDISNYLNQHIDDIDAEMINDNLSANDVNLLTEQLSDKEITQYLNENGWEHTE